MTNKISELVAAGHQLSKRLGEPDASMVKQLATQLDVQAALVHQYQTSACEPKYWISVHRFQSYLKFTKADAERDVAENGGIYVVPLYTSPQLDHVLPSELLASMEEVIRISDRDHAAWDRVKAGISSYHTAIINAGGIEWIGFDPAKEEAQRIPEGYVLVPQKIFLDADGIEAICSQCGNGQESGYGDYTDGLLWIGNIRRDNGDIVHGLHISSADYSEDGGVTLAEFPAIPQREEQ